MNKAYRVISVLTTAVFTTVGMVTPPQALAAPPAAIRPGGTSPIAGRPIPVAPNDPTDTVSSSSSAPSFNKTARRSSRAQIPVLRDGKVKIVIELTDPATAEVFAEVRTDEVKGVRAAGAAQAAAVAQLNRVERAQQTLLRPLAQLNATVIYRTQRVFNGIAVLVDASQLNAIESLPGVKAIRPLVTHQLDLASSVPLIGTPAVWNGLAGVTGQGVTIGIIDSGIDYLHAGFGGQGGLNPALYTQNITNVVGDVPGFPGAKVAGGYDFVGDSYDADPNSAGYQPIPQPDPDPMDCGPNQGSGHGSHVAGIAGGLGVNADGTTYTGPYDASLDFDQFKVGPGVAPGAQMYALRVFGCNGSSDVVATALEWATDPNGDGDFSDHLSVVNMSLGSPLGVAGTGDPTDIASDNAAKAGVVVVASAGNEADAYYITGSPGTADRVLSVASSVDSTAYANGFVVLTPTAIAGIYPAGGADFGPSLNETGPLTGTLVRAIDAANANGPSDLDGCSAIQNTSAISGNIALVDRGSCDFVVKVANAQMAGAAGVLIGNVASSGSPNDPPGMGGTPATTLTIPSISTNLATRNLLSNTLSASETITVVLTTDYQGQIRLVDPARVDTLSSFSSRGPRRPDSSLKPDISAPGDTIYSVEHGSGTEGKGLSGTSMAAPHVAGAMALLRQLYPIWTVEELKALAMNTAWHDVRTSNSLTSTSQSLNRAGAGRIDLVNATATHGIAFNNVDKGLVSVSFGAPEVATPISATKTILVENKGAFALNYTLSYTSQGDVPGVAYTFSPSTALSLPALSSALISVTMTADPAQMARTRDPGVPGTTIGLPRHFLSEESGNLVLIPNNLRFEAALSSANEVPTNTSTATGAASMSYDPATQQLAFSVTANLTATMAHIHLGLPRVNGPVIIDLMGPGGGVLNPGIGLSGVVTLTAQQVSFLLQDDFYVNVHTVDFPGGEIRGQLLNTASSALRVPIYAAPAAVSQMRAYSMTPNLALLASANVTSSMGVTPSVPVTPSAALTGSILLTGTGLSLGTNPTAANAINSLVSAFELQYISPRSVVGRGNDADLKYIGVASDYTATGNIISTTIYFAISTYGMHNTPLQNDFTVYIDVNRDGTDDYAVYNGPVQSNDFSLFDDVFVTWITDLNTGDSDTLDFLNGLPATVDTRPFNTNIIVLPVAAAALGMTNTTRFSYTVSSFSIDALDQQADTDYTPSLHFDVAQPGFDLTGGFEGVPIWDDQSGASIPVMYQPANFAAHQPRAVLLFHHHNGAGAHDELIGLNRVYMPVVSKFLTP